MKKLNPWPFIAAEVTLAFVCVWFATVVPFWPLRVLMCVAGGACLWFAADIYKDSHR